MAPQARQGVDLYFASEDKLLQPAWGCEAPGQWPMKLSEGLRAQPDGKRTRQRTPSDRGWTTARMRCGLRLIGPDSRQEPQLPQKDDSDEALLGEPQEPTLQAPAWHSAPKVHGWPSTFCIAHTLAAGSQ